MDHIHLLCLRMEQSYIFIDHDAHSIQENCDIVFGHSQIQGNMPIHQQCPLKHEKYPTNNEKK